ncbi:hypothetical protein [Variovorax sp. J22R115]|uniref:hypothetical protein n=1 Tax=Variovorax sp. J22R115 TaxID=3053509 RepID=UPI002577ED5F|nr:hypothetical protein [Variovorax sp. J22R115]MDM0050465.1 hypothetical protein [Variovorax sp. J22R115]
MSLDAVVTAFLKTVCLVVYAVALAGLAGWLRDALASAMQLIALVFLSFHALELPFVFGYVRRYPGPLAVSVVLTLLFGLLHWMPLTRK